MAHQDLSKKDKKSIAQFDDVSYDGPDSVPLDERLEKGSAAPVEKDVQDYLDSYDNILDITNDVKAAVDARCDGYTYVFDPKVEVALASAIRKVFGVDSDRITYKMYLQTIEEQIEMQQASGDEIFTQ